MEMSRGDHLPVVYGAGKPSPRRWGGRSDDSSLAIHLTIYTLERLAVELLPFYGEDCPIAVAFDNDGKRNEVFHGTLATLASCAAMMPSHPQMCVFVG